MRACEWIEFFSLIWDHLFNSLQHKLNAIKASNQKKMLNHEKNRLKDYVKHLIDK